MKRRRKKRLGREMMRKRLENQGMNNPTHFKHNAVRDKKNCHSFRKLSLIPTVLCGQNGLPYDCKQCTIRISVL